MAACLSRLPESSTDDSRASPVASPRPTAGTSSPSSPRPGPTSSALTADARSRDYGLVVPTATPGTACSPTAPRTSYEDSARCFFLAFVRNCGEPTVLTPSSGISCAYYDPMPVQVHGVLIEFGMARDFRLRRSAHRRLRTVVRVDQHRAVGGSADQASRRISTLNAARRVRNSPVTMAVLVGGRNEDARMTRTAIAQDTSSTAVRMAVEAHEAAAVVLQTRHPRAARRQREAAVAARARLLRTTVPFK